MCPSLIQIGSKTAEKNSAQTNRQTNRHYKNNGHLAVNQKKVSRFEMAARWSKPLTRWISPGERIATVDHLINFGWMAFFDSNHHKLNPGWQLNYWLIELGFYAQFDTKHSTIRTAYVCVFRIVVHNAAQKRSNNHTYCLLDSHHWREWELNYGRPM